VVGKLEFKDVSFTYPARPDAKVRVATYSIHRTCFKSHTLNPQDMFQELMWDPQGSSIGW
jgi:hypothetical protein